jgi:pimeloyl-ACP methyl ester carboxylesterase
MHAMPKTNVNGINIYYEGHGQGEPLVLIQGLGGGHASWFFQTRAFKKHYRVITFDNRGIGKTDKSSDAYTIKTMADDTIGLMDYLGVDKAHILGASLGGMVAQEIAIGYPQRVIKLVLVCTSAGERQVTDIHPQMLRAIGINEGSTEVDFRSADFVKLMSAIISLAFNKRLYRMLLLPISKVSMKSGRVAGHLEQMEAVMGHSTIDRLHLIEAPTLVITGTEDKIMSPHSSEMIASQIPNAKLVKVEGGSHAFFLEMRGRFNKEVLGFLRGS